MSLAAIFDVVKMRGIVEEFERDLRICKGLMALGVEK